MGEEDNPLFLFIQRKHSFHHRPTEVSGWLDDSEPITYVGQKYRDIKIQPKIPGVSLKDYVDGRMIDIGKAGLPQYAIDGLLREPTDNKMCATW